MGQLLRAKSQFKRFAASKGIEFSHGLALDRLNNSFTAFEISWLSSKSLGKLASLGWMGRPLPGRTFNLVRTEDDPPRSRISRAIDPLRPGAGELVATALVSLHRSPQAALRRQRRGPGVVGIDPVGVGLLLEPDILARRLLHADRAVLACRLEATERVRNAVRPDAIETAGQHGGILDRRGCALRHIGRHRVAGVAEQGHLAILPAR